MSERNIGYLESTTIMTSEEKSMPCIDRNGKTKTDVYQNDTSFTILMGMLQTIRLKILSLCETRSIGSTIWEFVWTQKKFMMWIMSILKGLGHLQKNGTDLKNDVNGTGNTIVHAWWLQKKKNTGVSFVERCIYLLEKKYQDSVHISAHKKCIIKKKNILKKEFVWGVEKVFHVSNVVERKHVENLVQLNLDEEVSVYDKKQFANNYFMDIL